jgi:hypothetical protein
MKITLKNDFHSTECTLIVDCLPSILSHGQVNRAKRALCGITDCKCGGILGERGPQEVKISYVWLAGEGERVELHECTL